MGTTYSDLQLDALRELANIGSGTAATALSSMLGRPIDVSVPNPVVLEVAEAVQAAGPTGARVTAVAIGIVGDVEAVVLLLFSPEAAATLCGLLGVEDGSDMALSALCEIGNVLGASYIGALGTMTGLALEPSPPQPAYDMLGAIVESVLLSAGDRDVALMLDSKLIVEGGEECSPSFLFIPSEGGVEEMLTRLGVSQ